MFPPACMVILFALPKLLKLMVPPPWLAIVILSTACRITSALWPSKVDTLSEAGKPSNDETKPKTGKSKSSIPIVCIVMLSGSSNSVPMLPFAAVRSATPLKKNVLPLTSILPPSPESSPPWADNSTPVSTTDTPCVMSDKTLIVPPDELTP